MAENGLLFNLWYIVRVSILNLDKKLLFIHNPKTGGTSLASIEWLGPVNHLPLWFFHEMIDRGMRGYSMAEMFGFAFVRHPLDRFVSAFHYNLDKGDSRLGNHTNFREFALSFKDVKPVHEEFDFAQATWANFPYRFKYHVHFLPQWFFLVDKRCKMVLDFVGKFENLDQDWKKVCELVGEKYEKLPHLRPSKHKPYMEYYDNETEKIIRNFYARDFKLFEYS